MKAAVGIFEVHYSNSNAGYNSEVMQAEEWSVLDYVCHVHYDAGIPVLFLHQGVVETS